MLRYPSHSNDHNNVIPATELNRSIQHVTRRLQPSPYLPPWMAVHAGIGFLVQVEPRGSVPSETRVAGTSSCWPERGSTFPPTFRRVTRANAEGSIGAEGGNGTVSVRRVCTRPSDRHGSTAFAVGMLRDLEERTALGRCSIAAWSCRPRTGGRYAGSTPRSASRTWGRACTGSRRRGWR